MFTNDLPSSKHPHVEMWTDGACISNNTGDSNRNGCGGWAVLIKYIEQKRVMETQTLYGWHTDTTSNRMELKAVIEGLKCLKTSCVVDIFTDSAYVCNVITKARRWAESNFVRTKKNPIANVDLCKEYLKAASHHTVIVHKVTSHSSITPKENEIVDQLAVAMKQLACSQKTIAALICK